MATVSIIPAKLGDSVELGKKEYDVVDGGKTIRQTVAVKVDKNYTREGVVSAIANHQAAIDEFNAILAEMDARGVGVIVQ